MILISLKSLVPLAYSESSLLYYSSYDMIALSFIGGHTMFTIKEIKATRLQAIIHDFKTNTTFTLRFRAVEIHATMTELNHKETADILHYLTRRALGQRTLSN